jgi:hypothetical protein
MQIKPLASIDLRDVKTGQPLQVKSVTMPGYRCLAEVELHNGHAGYADLPLGNHVYHPQVWDTSTDEVYMNADFLWTDIREEYKQAYDRPDDWTIVTKKPVRNAFVLNCLDFVYGHCLSRLLNYSFDHATRFPGLDCILMVPAQLAHLAPAGCAEIWIYHGPLKNLRFRNQWLERAFAELYARMDTLYLSPASLHNPEHIQAGDFGLRAATIEAPSLVFSYRENRAWGGNIYHQRAKLEKLGSLLAQIWPREQLYLVGLANKSATWKWEHWNSLLVQKPTLSEEQEMICRLSHSLVTIGCQGSNMLLPCLLSWSTIRLLPLDRLSHFLGGDYVGRPGSRQVETLFRTRMLYGGYELRDVTPETVFEIAKSMIDYRFVLDARFVQPTATAADLRKAAEKIPSEQKLSAEFYKPITGWPRFSMLVLRVLRKYRNRLEKVLGRIRWRGR